MRKERELKRKRVYIALILLIAIACTAIGAIILYSIDDKPDISFSPSETISGSQYVNHTYIIEENPNQVTPRDNNMFVGTANSQDYRALIKFNISIIPSSAYILSAKLNISMDTGCAAKINLSRIVTSWDPTYTSWNNRDGTNGWTNPGGDYDPIVLNSLTVSSIGNYSIDITSLVNYWHNNPAQNLGLILYPGNNTECIVTIQSTQSTQAPKLTIEYASSPPPQLGTVSSNAQTPSTLKSVGENINFTVGWTDNDATTNLFICNSSAITTSGCTHKRYCSSTNQPNPATCQYTVSYSDNKTSTYYAGICDSESCNVSTAKTFYMNHPSNITVVSPNGGETIGTGTTSYLIKFNVSDRNNDQMTASIYFGPQEDLTQTVIFENLLLISPTCTDLDNNRSTTNNCTYNWNPSTYYQDNVNITIRVNDTYTLSNDSSDRSINIRAISDGWDPTIQSYSIPSQVYSGQEVYINVTAKDDGSSIKNIWASINTTPLTNITLTFYQGGRGNGEYGNYSGVFTGVAPGSYKMRVYAQDQLNRNTSSSDLHFQIIKPSPEIKTPNFPQKTLPYHIIRITGEVNATTPLKGVFAILNVPYGFTFLNQSPQQDIIGNCSENNNAQAEWYVSAPIQEATYTLNITYYDQYSNNWTSNNFDLEVTSAMGSGGSNSIDIVGYPVIALDDEYLAKIYFKKSGILSNADSVEATLYNPQQEIAFGPFTVSNNPSPGEYNLTRTITTMTGQWELLINITDNLESYYANQFFTLISGIFDVRNIQIIDPKVNSLNISFEALNKGDIATDLWIYWNLTDSNGNPIPGEETSGDQTIGVNPEETKTLYISPKTTYVGQAKIAILGLYGATWEKEAGASRIFTIQPSGTNPPNGGGGGGGGGGIPEIVNKTSDFEITVEKITYISENIGKKVTLFIKNTGQQELTNLSVKIEGLNSSEYSVFPIRIPSLEAGKSTQFDITFRIAGQSDRLFSYLVKTDQLEKREGGLITVLNLKDFLLREISRIRDTINLLVTDEESRTELSTCSEFLDKAEQEISDLQLLNAQKEVIQAEDCVTKFKVKINQIPRPQGSNYLIWMILSLVLVLIILIIALAYLVHIRLRIINFLESSRNPEVIKQDKVINDSDLSKSKFDKKIEEIRRTLEG